MALSATVFKVELSVSDVDRGYYHTHNLTVARHPSENDKRMMLRVLAFALHAQDYLEMTKGLSTDNEPDIWCRELNGDIKLWLELGQPDVKRLRKACSKSQQVVIYCYGDKATKVWWEKQRESLSALKNLTVISINDETAEALSGLSQKAMSLQCTVNEGDIWFASALHSLQIQVHVLQ